MSYNRSHRRRKGSSALIPILIIAVGIIATAGFLVHSLFFGDSAAETARQEPNMEEVSFFEYEGNRHLNANHIHAVINGEITTHHSAPIFIDGSLHLPADFLRAYIDRYIFWEQNSNRLTITNANEVMRFRPNEDTYTSNWQPQPLAHPIREDGGMAYMSADMIMERYPVTISYQEEYNFVIVQLHRYQRRIYAVIADEEDDEDFFVPMRFGPDDQHPIMSRLNPGDRVISLNEVPRGEYYDGFFRVQIENGLTGYVLAENLGFVDIILAIPQIETRRPMTRAANEPINFAWHMNIGCPDAWRAPQGMNVISPVWFAFADDDTNGDIVSRARHDYVTWAHNNGMEVWPMLQDADRDLRFSSIISRAVLEDAYVRDHVIAQLMGFIEEYNLDGIQVDYEVVPPDIADQWIQFLRELSVPMREAGAVLSVAVKVPAPHNMFWNRTEIGLTVDYVIIMAYDEHWTTIDTAGPVASFGFVEDAIRNTLNEVPPYQVVVALPTYARIWREEFVDGEWQLVWSLRNETPRAVGMGNALARDTITSRGGEFFWDYIMRQYYGEVEFTENGVEVRYRVWLQDLRSMDEKLGLVRRNNLAGVGFWTKELGVPALWDLVYEHLN
ncbi:MAG: glycosyl hydrolase family 18 protein [Defluviitaleaceae bacterium]|nr:glycosyl hydrolase family 18 protein [Defluviitaleaceae bacterium]